MKTLVATSAIAILIGGIFVLDNNVKKVSGEKITETVTVESEEVIDSGKAKYAITKDNESSKELEVTVNFNDGFTKEDMKEYKQENKKNMVELSKEKTDIPTTITFTTPISIDEFEDLVGKYDIQVENFNIIAKNNDNSDQFIQGVPDENKIIPENKLKEALNGGQFKGVYSFEGIIPSENITEVSEEHNIYLADVSQEILSKKAKQVKKADETLDINVFDAYWFVVEKE